MVLAERLQIQTETWQKEILVKKIFKNLSITFDISVDYQLSYIFVTFDLSKIAIWIFKTSSYVYSTIQIRLYKRFSQICFVFGLVFRLVFTIVDICR